jgi:ATP-dependent Lon protease
MYIIRLNGFKKSEKVQIVKQYFIQEMESTFHLENCIIWKDSVIDWIIQNYCMEEEGVRNLKRKIESIYRTINMLRYIHSIPESTPQSNEHSNQSHQYITKWSKLFQFPIQFPLTLNTNMVQEMVEWQDNRERMEQKKIIQNMFL